MCQRPRSISSNKQNIVYKGFRTHYEQGECIICDEVCTRHGGQSISGWRPIDQRVGGWWNYLESTS